MATWGELENEDESDNDEGEANLALMAMTPSYTEYESISDLDSDKEDKVFSNLSRSDLISFIQEIMSRCQDKARNMKTLKNECAVLKEELKFFQSRVKLWRKITLLQ